VFKIKCEEIGGARWYTSLEVIRSALQSMRGSTLTNSCGLISTSSLASSASFGWRGNESEADLQDLTAQVKKLRVRIFIFFIFLSDGETFLRMLV